MASNYTENYGLCQWEATDAVLRTDFNEDNAKIDAALKELSRTAVEHTAAIAKLGNCQLYTTSYVGTGKYGKESDTSITFPKKPYLVIIQAGNFGGLMISLGDCTQYITLVSSSHYGGTITWTGSTMSWLVNVSDATAQFNVKDVTYYVLALLNSNV